MSSAVHRGREPGAFRGRELELELARLDARRPPGPGAGAAGGSHGVIGAEGKPEDGGSRGHGDNEDGLSPQVVGAACVGVAREPARRGRPVSAGVEVQGGGDRVAASCAAAGVEAAEDGGAVAGGGASRELDDGVEGCGVSNGEIAQEAEAHTRERAGVGGEDECSLAGEGQKEGSVGGDMEEDGNAVLLPPGLPPVANDSKVRWVRDEAWLCNAVASSLLIISLLLLYFAFR